MILFALHLCQVSGLHRFARLYGTWVSVPPTASSKVVPWSLPTRFKESVPWEWGAQIPIPRDLEFAFPLRRPSPTPPLTCLHRPVLAHRLIAVTLSESTSCSSLLLAGNVHRQKRNSSMRPRSDALLFPAPLIIVVSKPAPSDAHAHALALARTSLPSCPTGRLCLSA